MFPFHSGESLPSPKWRLSHLTHVPRASKWTKTVATEDRHSHRPGSSRRSPCTQAQIMPPCQLPPVIFEHTDLAGSCPRASSFVPLVACPPPSHPAAAAPKVQRGSPQPAAPMSTLGVLPGPPLPSAQLSQEHLFLCYVPVSELCWTGLQGF